MKTIGYLGLGVMGYGMTSNLIQKSGGPVYGYDPVPEARARFAANGGVALESAEELYRTCDISICWILLSAAARPARTPVRWSSCAAAIPRPLKRSVPIWK